MIKIKFGNIKYLYFNKNASKIIIGLYTALTSCGSPKFDNPVDPEVSKYENTTNTTSHAAAPKATISPNSDSPASSTSASSSNAPITTPPCLTDCSPVAGTTFTFSTPFEITTTSCTVSAVRSFDTGTELIVFSNANCGVRSQVYSQKFSYAGVANGAAIQLSDCSTGSTGVIEFSAARATSSSLISFTCKDTTSSFVTKVVSLHAPINMAGLLR